MAGKRAAAWVCVHPTSLSSSINTHTHEKGKPHLHLFSPPPTLFLLCQLTALVLHSSSAALHSSVAVIAFKMCHCPSFALFLSSSPITNFGGGDSRHFGPMRLLFLNWCRECFAACVVFLFFSNHQCRNSAYYMRHCPLNALFFSSSPLVSLRASSAWIILRSCFAPFKTSAFCGAE